MRGTRSKEKSMTVAVDNATKTILIQMIDDGERVVLSASGETARELIKGLTMALDYIDGLEVVSDGQS